MTDGTVPPRLVLVHGTRMDSQQWEPYRRRLPGIEVVAPDLPGHGARVDEPFTAEAALAAIEEAVESSAPGQDVVLAGHSLGGYLATLYAAQRPGTLRGLVLIGASADPGRRLASLYRAFATHVTRTDTERLAGRMNCMMRWFGADEEMVQTLPSGAAYAALPAAWQAVMDECGPDLLRDVDCPVLLVNGQLDQMRLDARRYAAAAPVARVVTVPWATHLMPLTHPDELAHILREAVAHRGSTGQLPTMGG